ncbi:MAG: phenylacetate--CoA ligase family protein [Chloroflexota bacterium]|nr:MAG: phenylacetate--CoA ligase family protein [Chloroflexota bacterium]
MYNYIIRRILAPALDLFRGTRTAKCLQELERSQWWSRSEILELQHHRLRKLLSHAYKSVPYYRRIFDERGLKPKDIEYSKDLVKLPILTKEVIRNNFDRLTADRFPLKETISGSTGGSTGEPLLFNSTRDDRLNWGVAGAHRVFMWAGKNIADKAVWIQNVYPESLIVREFWRLCNAFFRRAVILDVKRISEDLAVFVQKMEELQPEFIISYPSAAYLVARYIEKKGKSSLRPKAIITRSEPLYDYQRELFSRVFKCETYNIYGTWEVYNVAAECSAHRGLHIAAENVFVEVVDTKGEPVPSGVEGKILLTNLHNYAMPLIRYDIGDVGISSDEVCSCGRGLPLLAKVIGRTNDFIFTASGKPIPGIALYDRKLFALMNVEQFQIIQESYEHVTVKIVPESGYTQEYMERLAAEIVRRYQPILGENMHITVEFVDDIIVTAAGKRKFIISKLPPVDFRGL